MNHPAIAIAVTTSNHGVLIGKRRDGTPPWSFPGGKPQNNETPAATAARETKEETGLDITASHIIGERFHPTTNHLLTYLACTPTGDSQIRVAAPGELTEVRWASLAETTRLMPDLYTPVLAHLQLSLPVQDRLTGRLDTTASSPVDPSPQKETQAPPD